MTTTANDPNATTLKRPRTQGRQRMQSAVFILRNFRLVIGLIALLLAVVGIPLFLHFAR
jgi:hypothetical protein